MTRHVAYIEALGSRSPKRRARQRAILDAVGREYRPLPDKPPYGDGLIEGFAFSTRTTRFEAFARLVGILDSVDTDWRAYVRVWDGFARGDGEPRLVDPPRRYVLEALQRLFGR